MDHSPENKEELPQAKKQWETPSCTSLEDLKIEGGGGLNTEGGTGDPFVS